MKLISMTDFVLEQTELLYEKNQSKLIHRVVNYAQFLKQPSKLGMFVPCDDAGNIVQSISFTPCGCPVWDGGQKYQQAKERVLFEGFEIVEKREVYNSINGILIDLDAQTWQIEGSIGIGGGYLIDETIEDLVTLDLTLTETAIKQIGL
ncbi:hypothetical protein [Empedobacter falsenii]|uniref:hypothetical protein n=1 Tax=Empedobacter falsenii TaxID=343874 RepID=UPI003A801C9B